MNTKLDLLNNKYNMEVLKQNIYVLNLIDILKTQDLTSEFVINYILNKDFQLTEEENNISIKDIFLNQHHLINNLEIIKYLNSLVNNNNNKIHSIVNKNLFNFEDFIK